VTEEQARAAEMADWLASHYAVDHPCPKCRDYIITHLLAVRGEALEEAAQVAETTNVCGGPNGQPIARAIRALARSERSTSMH